MTHSSFSGLLLRQQVVDLPHGHLVPYPIEVKGDGTVTTPRGGGTFPDTRAPVLGGVWKLLPCSGLAVLRREAGYLLTT